MEFDGQFVRRRPESVAKRMDEFVRVRITGVNNLDLTLFQFDWDLTFVVFFMNHDGTLYGRFGTRSALREAERDISFEGLEKAMAGALELHAAFPSNKAALAGKRGTQVSFPTPVDFPFARARGMAKRCMSCHIVLNCERIHLRDRKKPVPDAILYPWPMPDVLGLSLDPNEMATVRAVTPNSAAAKAGLAKGDRILTLAGQPMLSIADVQWVLTAAKDPAEVVARVKRGPKEIDLTLKLAAGWRKGSDISWRSTTWMLRNRLLGMMRLVDLTDAERRKLGLGKDVMAFRQTRKLHPRFRSAQAGIRGGDLIVGYGEAKGRMTETQLIAWAMRNAKPGVDVSIAVLRGDQRVTVQMGVE